MKTEKFTYYRVFGILFAVVVEEDTIDCLAPVSKKTVYAFGVVPICSRKLIDDKSLKQK